MGVIRRQSINFSIVNFAGVLIGTLSTIFIYPLSREAYGLARFFIDLSWLMYPLVLFGMDSVSLKYFPRYKNQPETGSSFLTFILSNVLVISVVFVLLALTFGNEITGLLDQHLGMRFHDDPLISKYLWIAIPLVFLMGIAMLFNRFFSSFHKILFPAVLQNLIKLTLPVFILLHFYALVGISIIPYGILATYSLVLVCYLLYLALIGEFKFSFNFKGYRGKQYKEIMMFSVFSMFSSLGTLIAFRIDTVMVGALLNLDLTGEYGIASTIAQTIAIPTNAIITVAAPVISMAWANKDMKEIQKVYKKASTNLLIIGLLIYTGMWLCIDHLFAIMPNSESFEGARWIVLLLGFAKIVDMATSVNNEIISYSKFYKFNFYAVTMLAVLNIVFNLVFIGRFGILGAALATVLSLLLYNLVKLLFIYSKFHIQPFSMATLKLAGISLLVYGMVFWWPTTGSQVLDLLLKSGAIFIIFAGLTLVLRISEDVNQLYYSTIQKIKQMI